MKAIATLILLSLLMWSCANSKQEDVHDESLIDSVKAIEVEIMRNGLRKELSGQWINTSLFDSTLAQKKLTPWLNEFYGDLYLEITESDTAVIKGNMDGGLTYMKVIDSCGFSFFERVDQPVFTYSVSTDLITEKTIENKTILYRRAKKEDQINIIGNEGLFNAFFIDHFFTDDYFKQKVKPEIKEVWNGFLTYTPFTFDAVSVADEKGKLDWYAWEIKGDTLELYNTSSTEDEESGFSTYEIGALKEQYVKNK